MKSFSIVAVLLCLAAVVRSDDMKVGSAYGGAAAPAAGGYGGSSGGYGGSSGGYGGASIPSPPCPKNYVFSCQPNLQPAPCAQSGYGGAGAYSQNYPVYAVPEFIQGYQN